MYIIVINPTAISILLHPSNNHGHVGTMPWFEHKPECASHCLQIQKYKAPGFRRHTQASLQRCAKALYW